MGRTKYHRRRIPADLQGVVVDGFKLGSVFNVPLRDGMTRAKAEVFTDNLIEKARAQVNYRLTEPDAWELATAILDQYEALDRSNLSYDEEMSLLMPGGGPDVRGWLKRMGREFSIEDQARIAGWVQRVRQQGPG